MSTEIIDISKTFSIAITGIKLYAHCCIMNLPMNPTNSGGRDKAWGRKGRVRSPETGV
jgi:hypothetical protein